MAASMKLAPRSAAGRAAHSRRACAASALPLNEPAQRVGSRRALLAGLALTPALVSQFAPAWALIPDDEDEEMVKKAKANRKRQLEADKVLQRQFMAEEGLVDRQLEGQLVPLEKGVIRLAQVRAAVGRDSPFHRCGQQGAGVRSSCLCAWASSRAGTGHSLKAALTPLPIALCRRARSWRRATQRPSLPP